MGGLMDKGREGEGEEGGSYRQTVQIAVNS